MLNTLSVIGEKTNQKGITWGVGGSLLLYFHHLIDHPNDIDIIVAEDDAIRINHVMNAYGVEKETSRLAPFQTKQFSKYRIEHTDIDIMGGFAIEHSAGIYKLAFSRESIVAYEKVNRVAIPLCSLEDWFILYMLIPNREDKACLIEEHFKMSGIHHPRIFETALKQPLPDKVKKRIIYLLNFVLE